jgi:glycosyltransferase involved in cell wall biosynthesis
MASGLPVLSADLPVHREVCGDAARYFSLDEEGALAKRTIALLLDEGERVRMAASGRERVASLFSWDEHVERLLRLIREILSVPPGKRGGEKS